MRLNCLVNHLVKDALEMVDGLRPDNRSRDTSFWLVNRRHVRLVGVFVNRLVMDWLFMNRLKVNVMLIAVFTGLRVNGVTLVSDAGLVAVIVGHVVDDLNPSVGQGDFVAAARHGAGALLDPGEVGAASIVLDSIFEGVRTFL